MIRLAIVGSRTFGDEKTDERMRKRVFEYVSLLPKDTVIVSGGAQGIDTYAEEAAEACGFETDIHRVSREDYRTYGNYAFLRRNSFIIAACDKLVAFHDGVSKGTLDSIKKAKRAGKLLDVFYVNDEEQ